MEKGALFAQPRVIPILTVPYPGGGRVAKQRFVSKGGWQATNNRPLEWNAGLRTVASSSGLQQTSTLFPFPLLSASMTLSSFPIGVTP